MATMLGELFSKQGFKDMRDALHDSAINAAQGLADGATLLAAAPVMAGNAIYQRFSKNAENKAKANRMYVDYINKVTGLNNIFNQYWDEAKAADGVDYSKNNPAATAARVTSMALPAMYAAKPVAAVAKPLALAATGGNANMAAAVRIGTGLHPLSFSPALVEAAPNIVDWLGRTVKGVDPELMHYTADEMRKRQGNMLTQIARRTSVPGMLYPHVENELGRAHAMHGLFLGGRPHVYNNSAWFEPRVGRFPGVPMAMNRFWRNDPSKAMLADAALQSLPHPAKFPDNIKVNAELGDSMYRPLQYMNREENERLFNRSFPSLMRAWESEKDSNTLYRQ